MYCVEGNGTLHKHKKKYMYIYNNHSCKIAILSLSNALDLYKSVLSLCDFRVSMIRENSKAKRKWSNNNVYEINVLFIRANNNKNNDGKKNQQQQYMVCHGRIILLNVIYVLYILYYI